MITLSKETQTELVLKILNDSIIFDRSAKGINKVLQSFNPENEGWEAECLYNGFAIAYSLMGFDGSIEDEQITNKLFNVYLEQMDSDLYKPVKERYNAKQLAEHIYIDWLQAINEYEIEKVLN